MVPLVWVSVFSVGVWEILSRLRAPWLPRVARRVVGGKRETSRLVWGWAKGLLLRGLELYILGGGGCTPGSNSRIQQQFCKSRSVVVLTSF